MPEHSRHVLLALTLLLGALASDVASLAVPGVRRRPGRIARHRRRLLPREQLRLLQQPRGSAGGNVTQALPGPVLRTGTPPAWRVFAPSVISRTDTFLVRCEAPGAGRSGAGTSSIVQEHSRLGVPYADDEPAGTIGDRDPFFDGAANEVADIVAGVGSATSCFYMTWAKEAFPEPDGGALAAKAYRRGRSAGTARTVAPVGLAWARVRTERPDIVLFHPDGSHPSPAGTYLNTRRLLRSADGPVSRSARQRSCHGIEMRTPGRRRELTSPFHSCDGVTDEMAAYLQRVAWEVVADVTA